MSKTVALICIAKNEERHVKRFLESFLPVVDHVYFTDTGSSDKTIEIAREVGKDKITINHFEWCDDFGAAREHSAKNVKEDYILWADLDDSLRNPEDFIRWKNESMHLAEMWLAHYNYAITLEGKVVCQFARERVYKNDKKFSWKYACHEGVNCDVPFQAQFVNSWAIDHLRTPEDLQLDKGRNLRIFERLKKEEKLDPRMQYYYGKELFEAGKVQEALKELLFANLNKTLEIHDRTLCIQYACYAMMQLSKFTECINLAHSGLLISPRRAEFFVLIADAYIKLNQMENAIAYLEAAKACPATSDKGFAGFIFQHKDAYTSYPHNQLARVYAHLGDFDKASFEASICIDKFQNEEAKVLLKEITMAKEKREAYKTAKDSDDIAITCAGGLYEWDEKVYLEKGIGGSETAAVEMARHLKKLTGKRVLVFNERKEPLIADSGVEYVPAHRMPDYFGNFKPKLHVAWRHNFKLTDAKTVAWSHDLIIPGGETHSHYEKYLALSDFHKSFVKSVLSVPDEKIFVTRNGINPDNFKEVVLGEKDENKIIFVSSPDRGLDRAIQVIDLARTVSGKDLKLHVFYGFDNLIKMGKNDEADRLKKLANKHWITLHGNVSQKELKNHYKDAAVWLYPTNFMETFCISALETVLCGVYPLVRQYGALPNTLSELPSTILDRDCESLEDLLFWAHSLLDVISKKLWQNIDYKLHSKVLADKAWEQVAKEWITQFI